MDDDDAGLLEDDPCSVVHVSMEVLKALSLQEGSLATISYHNPLRPRIQQLPLSILVRLRLLPWYSPQREKHGHDRTIAATKLQLFLSPTAAANLGLAWDENLHGNDSNLCSIEPFFPYKDEKNGSDERTLPRTVTMRFLGRHPHTFYVGEGKPWPNILSRGSDSLYPLIPLPAERYSYIVRSGTIISSFYPGSPKDSRGETNALALYIYEVLSIDRPGHSTSSNSCSQQHYMTTPSTIFKFELERSNSYSGFRRLPPLLSLQQFYSFYQHCVGERGCGKGQAQQRTNTLCEYNNNAVCIPPHPNLQTVQQALLHAGRQSSQNGKVLTKSATLTVAEHLIPLIGNNTEHDLTTCVETASHQAGMNCLSIRCGLAALGQIASQGNGRDRSSLAASGSLQDAMAGLEAALDMVLQPQKGSFYPTNSSSTDHGSQLLPVPSLPCVLHLYDIDSEWTTSGRSQDEQMRCEQEERFWTI